MADQRITGDLNKVVRVSNSNRSAGGELSVAPRLSDHLATTHQSIWTAHDSSISSLNATRGNGPSATANVIILLDEYQNVPFQDRNVDPLNWWKSKTKDGELVQFKKLVQKYHCIPATSVPSEQLFSKAGELISARRNRLSSQNIDMLLFINKNC